MPFEKERPGPTSSPELTKALTLAAMQKELDYFVSMREKTTDEPTREAFEKEIELLRRRMDEA